MKWYVSFSATVLSLSSFLGAEQPILDQVVSGDVNLTSQQNTLLIEQASHEAWLDWQQFSISEDKTVQFVLSDSSGLTVNRVTGNDLSTIFGQLQSNGTLYLINPNGILFSESARVDVGGLFVSDHWLDETLGLTPSPASHGITVFGQIHSREQLTLLANELTQAGTLQASNIQLLGNASALLQLDNKGTVSVAVPANGGDTWIENSGVIVANNQLYIGSADTNAWLNSLAEEHRVSVGGTLTAPSVEIYGSTIEVVDAQLQAELMHIESQSQTLISNSELRAPNGEIKIRGEEIQLYNHSAVDVGNGKLTIGGELQGQGTDRNADFVFVSHSVDILANAEAHGDGGDIVLWSDGHTEFHGSIEAKGGALSGDGGFAEVSGKETLTFRGDADLTAAYGRTGTLLLDPTIITIANGNGGSDDIDGVVHVTDYAGQGITIFENTLEGLTGAVIALQASQSIVIEDLADNALTLDQTGSVTFEVINTAGQGSFIMQGADDAIVMTGGGDLTIDVEGVVQVNTGGQNTVFIDVSNIEFTNGGNLSITASPNAASITSDELIISVGDIVMTNAGDISIQANNTLNNDVNSAEINVGSVTLSTANPLNRVEIGATANNTNVAAAAGNATINMNGNINVTGLNDNRLDIGASSSNAGGLADISLNGNVFVQTTSAVAGSVVLETNTGGSFGGSISAQDITTPGGYILIGGGTLTLSQSSAFSTKIDSDSYSGLISLGSLGEIVGGGNSLTLEYGSYSGFDLSKFSELSELNLATQNSFSLGIDDSGLNFSLASLNALPATVNALNFSSVDSISVSNLSNIGFDLGLTADSNSDNIGAISLAGLSFSGSQVLTTNGDLTITEALNLASSDFIVESGAVTIDNGAVDLTIDADLDFSGASSINLTGSSGTAVVLINRGDIGGSLALQNVSSTNALDVVVDNRFNSTNVTDIDLNGGSIALLSVGSVNATNVNVGSGTVSISGSSTGTDVVASGDWVYDRLIVESVNSFTNEASLVGDRLTSVNVGADITLEDGSSISSDRVILNAGGNVAVTGVGSSSPSIPSISIVAGENITDGGNTQSDIDAYWIYGLELSAVGNIADSLAVNYQVGVNVEDIVTDSGSDNLVVESANESKNPVQSSQASIGNLPRNSVDLYVPECNSLNRECRKNNAIRKFLGALLIGGALPE